MKIEIKYKRKRVCQFCGKAKTLSEFSHVNAKKNSYRGLCKVCFAKKVREEYQFRYQRFKNGTPKIVKSLDRLMVDIAKINWKYYLVSKISDCEFKKGPNRLEKIIKELSVVNEQCKKLYLDLGEVDSAR